MQCLSLFPNLFLHARRGSQPSPAASPRVMGPDHPELGRGDPDGALEEARQPLGVLRFLPKRPIRVSWGLARVMPLKGPVGSRYQFPSPCPIDTSSSSTPSARGGSPPPSAIGEVCLDCASCGCIGLAVGFNAT